MGDAKQSSPWVLISPDFHERGGQSKAVAALADHLIGRGVPLYIVGHDIHARFRGVDGVTLREVSKPRGVDLLGRFLLPRAGRSVARRVTAEFPAARVVSNGGCCDWPDINWVHYVHHAWEVPPQNAPAWFRLKNSYAVWLAKRQERRALQRAKLVLSNSLRTRSDLVEGVGLPEPKVENVYYGCDPDWVPASPEERTAARAWLGQSPERPLAVFVGGFGYDERKGFDTLWEAWRRLCQNDDWDVDLVCAGGGKGVEPWRRRTAEAGLEDRVRLIGFTERIFDVLAAADVLVSPVRYEAYGLNVQEAICRGVPAVVSARAGAAEQYPESMRDLLLDNPDDIDGLCVCLRRWRENRLDHAKETARLSGRLRAWTWNRMAERVVELAGALA